MGPMLWILGMKFGQVGAALHRHHQRKRLIADVGVDLLQFVVVVKLEILQLQSVDEVAIAVAHGGGRNDDVDPGTELGFARESCRPPGAKWPGASWAGRFSAPGALDGSRSRVLEQTQQHKRGKSARGA